MLIELHSFCLVHKSSVMLQSLHQNTAQIYLKVNTLPNYGLEEHKSMLMPIAITSFAPLAKLYRCTIMFPPKEELLLFRRHKALLFKLVPVFQRHFSFAF